MIYKIQAEYTVIKELEVEVREGDPRNPANWNILVEHDMDCTPRDVLNAEPMPE